MAGFFDTIKGFLGGTPEKHKRVSTLLPNQQPLQEQLVKAGQESGAGGAFGDAADYYRSNLSNNPADFNAFAAPQLRQFNEDIIPNLSEQFAGMGAGGLSSSGFRNAGIQAGTDLSERLGALRAQLRNSSAAGLANIGQMGLGNFSADQMTQSGSQGILPGLAGSVVNQAVAPWAGGVGAWSANQANNWFGGGGNQVGKNKDPYTGPGGLSFGP